MISLRKIYLVVSLNTRLWQDVMQLSYFISYPNHQTDHNYFSFLKSKLVKI
jgi:hypothetical protein